MSRACLVGGCKDFVFHSETRNSRRILSQSRLMFNKFSLVTLWRICCGGAWVKAGVLKETLGVISVSGDGGLCQGGGRGVGSRSHTVGLF